MSDAPKNPSALKDGKVQQTYRVAGKPYYKDPITGEMFHMSQFDSVDLNWRTDREAWERKYGREISTGNPIKRG